MNSNTSTTNRQEEESRGAAELKRVDTSNGEERDYLPARMINEFVYCPRLFYFEQVEGVFLHNEHTLDGADVHRRVDKESGTLPDPEEIEPDAKLLARGQLIASDTYGIIARMDVLEVSGGRVVPVDYKRGEPPRDEEGLPSVWPADRAQILAQVLILRDNGYSCDEGVVYYAATKQRIRVPATGDAVRWLLEQIERAREIERSGRIPPPLFASRKCEGCSLAPVCLPDEYWLARNRIEGDYVVQKALFPELQDDLPENYRERPETVRPLGADRSERKILHVNEQGARITKRGMNIAVVTKEGKHTFCLKDIDHVCTYGNVQMTTQAEKMLLNEGIPIIRYTYGGYPYGLIEPFEDRNAPLRHEQHLRAESQLSRLQLARELIAAKINNQRVLLLRNHVDPPPDAVRTLKYLIKEAERASTIDSLLGIEGSAARVYFQHFAGMLKPNDPGEGEEADGEWSFEFTGRNRRPPRDPVNGLLSFSYALLCRELTLYCQLYGLDPYVGFYHRIRSRRPALALDLMEPFRPILADSAVLSAINRGYVRTKHFVRSGTAVNLNPSGRSAFLRAYENRLGDRMTHPVFGYVVTYRQCLKLQVALVARYIRGDISRYPTVRVR